MRRVSSFGSDSALKPVHIIAKTLQCLSSQCIVMEDDHNQNERTKHSQRYLVCLWGELNGIRRVIDSLKANLVDQLDADVALVGQLELEDDLDRMNIIKTTFGKRLIHCEIYDKPDIAAYYGPQLLCTALQSVEGTWKTVASLQRYINFAEYGIRFFNSIIKSHYDVYVFTRTDLEHAFPFPRLHDLLHRSTLSSTFFGYRGRSLEGVNHDLLVVPRSLLIDFLWATCSYIKNARYHVVFDERKEVGAEFHMNVDQFMRLIFRHQKWRLSYIQANACIGAEECVGDVSVKETKNVDVDVNVADDANVEANTNKDEMAAGEIAIQNWFNGWNWAASRIESPMTNRITIYIALKEPLLHRLHLKCFKTQSERERETETETETQDSHNKGSESGTCLYLMRGRRR